MAGLQGRTFGGYELTAPLGSGGMYEVYRARPTRQGGREAVVKVIPPEFARQPGLLPHFRQVTQLAGRLANHAHILPLMGSGEEAGFLYLISPYVADGTLKDWIVRGGRMGESDVGPFFHQLCDALAYAHSLGVVHGDVKPSNVYLFEGRHVLLGDFGLLWDVAHMDMTHAGPGTEAVAFMAPEVARGQTSQASDIYSAGEVLFTAITGQPPFRASTPGEMFSAHASQPVPHLMQVAPGLLPAVQALDPVVQRAMAKRPEDRFPSAMALSQAIEMAIRQQSQHAPQPQQPHAGPSVPFGMLGVAGPAAAAGGPFGAPALGTPMPGPFAAPGLGGAPLAARPAAGAGLQALNFPPLRGEVDGDMDQGRIVVSQHAPPTAPTMRVAGAAAGAGAPLGFAPAMMPAPAVEPPTMRVPAPAPAAGPVPPAPLSMVPPPTGAPPLDGGGFGPQAMGAIRIPPPDMSARRQTGQHPALAPADGASYFPPAAVGRETGGRLPALADDFDGQRGYTDGFSASLASVEVERPFSPTELGLPRLTSPDLQELPPSWQDLVRDAPRQRRGEYGGSYRPEPEMSAEWAASMADGSVGDWSYAPEGDDMAAPAPRRKRRWPMLVGVLLILLLVMNVGVLVVARPDLCPVSQCGSLSAKAHQYLPFLAQPTPTIAAVSGQPTAINISVAAGKSATVSLQFKDVSTGAVSWSAATSLSWVSVSPSRGAAQPGDSVPLTLTADASTISAGKYTTTLTITAEGQVVRVPVTITVQAAS